MKTKIDHEAYVAEMKIWIQQEELRKQSCIRAGEFYAEQIQSLQKTIELEDEQRASIQVCIDRGWHEIGVANDAQRGQEAEPEEDAAQQDIAPGCPERDGGPRTPAARSG